MQRRHRTARIPTAAWCAVVALVLVAPTSCGDGSGDDGSARASTASAVRFQWQRRAEAGCQRWNDRYAHLRTARPDTAAEAVRHSEEVDQLAAGIARELDRLGLPQRRRGDAERLVELSERMAEATSELAKAAAAGDGPAVDAATRRIERLGEQIDELATDLDVPACGGY